MGEEGGGGGGGVRGAKRDNANRLHTLKYFDGPCLVHKHGFVSTVLSGVTDLRLGQMYRGAHKYYGGLKSWRQKLFVMQ